MLVDSTLPSTLHPSSPLISIPGLRKECGNGARIVDDFSLEGRRGEFETLLGASGCGKSNLLKIIAGLTSITSGTISTRRPDRRGPATSRTGENRKLAGE